MVLITKIWDAPQDGVEPRQDPALFSSIGPWCRSPPPLRGRQHRRRRCGHCGIARVLESLSLVKALLLQGDQTIAPRHANLQAREAAYMYHRKLQTTTVRRSWCTAAYHYPCDGDTMGGGEWGEESRFVCLRSREGSRQVSSVHSQEHSKATTVRLPIFSVAQQKQTTFLLILKYQG